MVAENAVFIGKLHILDIGLLPGFLQTIKPAYNWVDRNFIARIYKPRDPFAHKGTFGHALVVAGSYGKMGAAVLCTRACLRSGAGLVTAHIPYCGLNILQISAPEAMCDPDENEQINTAVKTDLQKFNAIGMGPGIGTAAPTAEMVKRIFSDHQSPLVLDADALNIVAAEKLLYKIPKASVLTPHPKEFERLFGPCENDFARIEKAIEQARELQLTIVLKGHHSFIADPNGNGYFNSTGNAGMATGGTGDVLAGLITGLTAQKYSSTHAAILGVYWHGAAGDLAASYLSQEAMLASDLVDQLGMVILSQFNSEPL
jgi:NAD(P)H-hydrate epimerase